MGMCLNYRLLASTQVTSEQRSRAKQLAYGLLYGMGKPALASTLKTDLETAGKLSAAFKASLPGVTAWMKREQDRCRCPRCFM